MRHGVHLCMNCNNPTKGRYNYRGVVLCSHCSSLAIMCDKKAIEQCKNLLTMYQESLRVALVEGKLRPSTNIPDRSKKVGLPTPGDLRALLSKIATIKGEAEGDAGAGGDGGDSGQGNRHPDACCDPLRPGSSTK